MTRQTYKGNVTVYGCPGIAVLPGLIVWNLVSMSVDDSFRLSEQRDTAGDVARITPWDNQRNLTITFYPVLVNYRLLDLPVPGSKVTIVSRTDIPCPRAYVGDWRYVGPGDIATTNTGLMTMRLSLRKWNPWYGQTLTPT